MEIVIKNDSTFICFVKKCDKITFGIQKCNVRDQKCNIRDQKCNIRDQKCNIGIKSATSGIKSATSGIKSATSEINSATSGSKVQHLSKSATFRLKSATHNYATSKFKNASFWQKHPLFRPVILDDHPPPRIWSRRVRNFNISPLTAPNS